MSATKLIRVKEVTGGIVVETGLHIGGSAETMEIGGLDNPVIRSPADNLPYIPGSSLKGRMRSLSEWYLGELPTNGDVTKPDAASATARVFGKPAKSQRQVRSDEDPSAYQIGPTRLIVRDAALTDESRRQFREEGRELTEVKSENSIDRLTSVANPRPMERVLPGVAFAFEMRYRVFDVDGDNGRRDEELFEGVLMTALALLEADALGGGSSRGNGKIRFENLAVDGEQRELPQPAFPAPATS
jgi:CRISPR-associated protein Csm3